MATRARVLVADGREQVRSALRLLIEQAAGLDVAGEVDEVGSLPWQAERLRADLVLLDWELAGADMQELLVALHHRCPDTQVVAMSGRPEARREAAQAGVDAFVSKADPPEGLLAILSALRRRR